jgi:pSer/pThr/pTyr-binding forkhead associated (FHA) protein
MADREVEARAAELREQIRRHDYRYYVLDDPEISRRHATLRRTPTGYVLVDHDSRNGTLVNGVQITQQALYDEDEIRVGNTVLSVIKNLQTRVSELETKLAVYGILP